MPSHLPSRPIKPSPACAPSIHPPNTHRIRRPLYSLPSQPAAGPGRADAQPGTVGSRSLALMDGSAVVGVVGGWALAAQGLAPRWTLRRDHQQGSTRGVLGRQGGAPLREPFRERGPLLLLDAASLNTSHSPDLARPYRVPHDIGRSTSPGTVLEAATCGLGRGAR